MSHKGSKSGDKLEQYWTSISKEKLDALRWVFLHSGINTSKLQNDEGLTGLQVAAKGDKAKALLVMLDIMRQKRELADSIDVSDERGMTPLMMAAAAGAAKCVDHLLYYGASQTAKSAEGFTAREYAARGRKGEALAVFDEANDTGKDAAEGPDDAVDADGLTSTQRNKLKKRQLKDGEHNRVLAAVTAAAATMTLEEGGGEEEGGGAGSASAAGASSSSSAAAPVAVADPFGRPPLRPLAGRPAWTELLAVWEEKRRELLIDRVGKKPEGEAALAAEAAAAAALGGEEVDPALWHSSLLNRLELRLPRLTLLSPSVGHLVHLQTLILSGHGLTSLPEALGACVDLKFLDVARNALTVLPDCLGRLPRLEVLDVRDNALTSTAPLLGCTALLTLTADRNAIEELTLNFAGLHRLETLSLSSNKLTSLPEAVSKQLPEGCYTMRAVHHFVPVPSSLSHCSPTPRSARCKPWLC